MHFLHPPFLCPYCDLYAHQSPVRVTCTCASFEGARGQHLFWCILLQRREWCRRCKLDAHRIHRPPRRRCSGTLYASHTLLSYPPLIHSSHTLLSYTPLIHSSRTLFSYTPLMHSSHTLLSYTLLMHSSHTLLSYTPLTHSSHTLLSCTPLIHSSHSVISYTPLIHSSHTLTTGRHPQQP
jgi:hypothetical protein